VEDGAEFAVDELDVDPLDPDGPDWAAEEPQAASRTVATTRHVRCRTDRLRCTHCLIAPEHRSQDARRARK
jgi:hypothetical protein